MLHVLTGEQLESLCRRVAEKCGDGWQYHHSISGIGPDGRQGIVDVFSNGSSDFELRRTLHVLNGKVLEPH